MKNLILIAVAALMVSSCLKRNQNRLAHTWELEKKTEQYYHFADGKDSAFVEIDGSGQQLILEPFDATVGFGAFSQDVFSELEPSGIWDVEPKKQIIHLQAFNPTTYAMQFAKYTVYKINSSKLKIGRFVTYGDGSLYSSQYYYFKKVK